MNCYLTWDLSGEYLWYTTPYRNEKRHVWQAEHETPDNKIPVVKGTLEFFSWEAVNAPHPSCIYRLDGKELKEVKKYAITKISRNVV